MAANGMNYSLYNLTYAQLTQSQTLYGQRFAHPLPQPPVPPFNPYQLYPTMPPPAPLNSYDHVIRSAAESLVAFHRPPEPASTQIRPPSHYAQVNGPRRAMTHPSTNLNTTRTYYCEICRIACGGHATYQAHLSGSKHKKKELLSQNTQPSANSPNKSTIPSFRCELCDITCTGADAYKAHMDGSKHEKAVKLHRRLGKTIPPVEPPTLNHTSDSQSAAQEEKASSESLIKPIGEEYIETTYDASRKPVLFHCKLCDCKFNDANAKDAHLKGKRHRLSYRKKVNPQFEIDNHNNSNTNKSSSPQQRSFDTPSEPLTNQSIAPHRPSIIDDDTRSLMTFHEQIIPSPSLLTAVEQFVTIIEGALKSCSERLRPPSAETLASPSPLIGVSRIGSLAKSLLIKSDRQFQLVIICTQWPTRNLFEQISTMLIDHFPESWRIRLEIRVDQENEMIEVKSPTDHGMMTISIQMTSMSIPQQEQTEQKSSGLLLSRAHCLSATHAVQSVRWFQNNVSTRQHASALIRCLRYKTKTSRHWQALSSEAIEILIEYTLAKTGSAVLAFRRVLEHLAGGLVLSNGPGVRLPWQNSPIKNVFDCLSDQERNDITCEAQNGLRLIAFGALDRWLGQTDLSYAMLPFQKRAHPEDDDGVTVKRPCLPLQ